MIGNEKKIILFLGLPGSGKTTQSVRLGDAFDFLHLTTSRIIRDKFRNIPLGIDPKIDGERRKYDEGKILDPELVALWVNEAMKHFYPITNGIILDGSPRSQEEAERLMPTLLGLYGEENIRAIHLKVTPETAFLRSSARLICVSCEKSYPQNLEISNQRCGDNSCQGVLTRKLLDKPEIFEERVRLFDKTTRPAINFFASKNLLCEVNGEGEVAEVFRNIIILLK